MQLAIYTRDQGIVKFHGEQDWDSIEQALEYFCRGEDTLEAENLIGWPHHEVTWHGDLGIAQ